MTARWLAGLSLVLGLWGTAAMAEEVVWRPVQEPSGAHAASAAAVAETLPSVSLGTPRPLSASPGPVWPVTFNPEVGSAPGFVARAQSSDLPPPAPTPGSTSPTVPLLGPSVGPPPFTSAPELFNGGAVPQAPPPPQGLSFWDKCKDVFNLSSGPLSGTAGRHCFESDHCFDGFISPVTNPFLFEDPRSLTEVRPIFMYQTIPGKNPVFQGGNIDFFGLQGRVALTDRLSIVLNELGGVWLNANNSPFPDIQGHHSGFSEVEIGPKFTFLRSEQTGTLGAAGLIFQIPIGTASVFQDTGTLSMVPYITMAQNFWKTSYGSMNAMGEIGYDFATDNRRSDNFFMSLHLDYDIGNLHKFYPFLEMNWWNYTHNGSAQPFDFEGADLVNFGSSDVKGHNLLTLAPGMRFKFNECVQLGIAAEFPVVGTRDLESFRLTMDLIFRY